MDTRKCTTEQSDILRFQGQVDKGFLGEESQLVLPLPRVGQAHSLHLDTVPAAHLVHDGVILLVLESGVLEVGAHLPLWGGALDDHIGDLQGGLKGRVLESEDNRLDGDLHAVHYLVHIVWGKR